ncbi:MAG: cobalamin-dependent protein [Dehalococcoidia bacterium]|nr:cobalamin-dependent protein [Dehalococcoidia bacterium]
METGLVVAVRDLDRRSMLNLVNMRMADGIKPSEVLKELQEGMNRVIERYDRREYRTIDIIVANELYKEAVNLLEPALSKEPQVSPIGKVVMGTAQGDVHDQTDVLCDLLRAVGFEVSRLGADVAPNRFVEELQRTNAPILCLSGIVSSAFEGMKKTVEAVHQAGLKVKVIIGGGVTNEEVRKYVGADVQTQDAVEGVQICKEFIKGEQSA